MHLKRLIGGSIAVLSLAAIAAGSASAKTYDWSFTNTSNNVIANGVLDTNTSGDVLSLTGTVDGQTITGFTPGAGNDGVFEWDNVVSTSTPHVDFYGLLFQAGGLEWNIYNGVSGVPTGTFPNGDTLANSANNFGGVFPGTFNIQAVPEPATWAMLILGVGMIGFAARRRSATALAA